MKKKTYSILSKLPLVNLVVDLVCKPVMFCSPGMVDGAFDDLVEYARKHPDVLITEKVAKEIRSVKR